MKQRVSDPETGSRSRGNRFGSPTDHTSRLAAGLGDRESTNLAWSVPTPPPPGHGVGFAPADSLSRNPPKWMGTVLDCSARATADCPSIAKIPRKDGHLSPQRLVNSGRADAIQLRHGPGIGLNLR